MIDQKKRQEQLAQLQKNIRDNAEHYKRLFSGPDGQYVLKDLEKRCFVNRSTYDPDEKKMAINEGRRSIFVHINNLVNKDVETLLDELKEGK
jgi:hypothetical protein